MFGSSALTDAGTLSVTVIGLLCCVLGMRLFRKRAGEMVDEL